MTGAVEKFHEFTEAEFVDPNRKINENLDTLIEALRGNELWHARSLVIKQAISGNCSAETKSAALQFYEKLVQEEKDAQVFVEAARAAAVFEEPGLLLSFLESAQSAIGFNPKVTGLEVKLGPHQTRPSLQLVCVVESSNEEEKESSESIQCFEEVPLQSTDGRFSTPEFLTENDKRMATSGLSNLEASILLLLCEHIRQQDGSVTSISAEQALPYVRRVIQSSNFSQLDLGIQMNALFYRSILEVKDINELERGTVQLMKIGIALESTAYKLSNYFYQLIPVSWKMIDENAARRLVAMSDFGNAIPIYRRLNKQFDLAICLASSDNTNEAIKVLKDIQPQDNRVLMLMGDLTSNSDFWLEAWQKFKDPKAKLRLSRVALSQKNPEGALDDIKDLLSVSSNDHEALLLGGHIALSLEKWDIAASYLRRALAINEDDTANWSNLATALIQSGKPELALHALKQAIRVNQNADPNFATYTNYISLSAQLKQWDESVVGLLKLVGAVDKGASPFIGKVSAIFPRLVHHYTTQTYTNDGMHKFVLDLFTQKLVSVIPSDDPILQRLNAKLYLWSGNFQAGLKCSVIAFDAILQSGVDFSTDIRARTRLELYATEAIDALAKYGDKPGRIEGSQAFPGWKTKVYSIEQAVKKVLGQ